MVFRPSYIYQVVQVPIPFWKSSLHWTSPVKASTGQVWSPGYITPWSALDSSIQLFFLLQLVHQPAAKATLWWFGASLSLGDFCGIPSLLLLKSGPHRNCSSSRYFLCVLHAIYNFVQPWSALRFPSVHGLLTCSRLSRSTVFYFP
jgi:hypothetical protein